MTVSTSAAPPRARDWSVRARFTPPEGATVAVERLTRWFGDVVALSDVSFAIQPGVTAVLGPNGAGKSTLLRVLCGLSSPSKGHVAVLGRDPRTDIGLMGRIGLVPQQEAMFESMSALEFVRTAAALHRVPAPKDAAAKALGAVEFDPGDGRPVRALSKGNRQRVKVAQAIVHDPEILILDEPLEGLDPRQRLRMIELMRARGDAGGTVMISSHVLDEVERFGSRVLMLAQGRLIAEGDFHSIRALMDDRPHRLRVRTSQPRRLASALIDEGLAIGVTMGGDGVVHVETDDVSGFRSRIAALARTKRARLTEIAPLDDDLESVFRYLLDGMTRTSRQR